jgi:hypothetical protein
MLGLMDALRALREQFRQVARAEPLGTVLTWCALAVTTLSIAAILLTVQWLTPTERASILIVSLVSWVLLIALGWTRRSLPKWGVFGAIAVTLTLAVVTPSYQSKDVYSYAMYGRILAVHHHSPYDSYPMHFEGDPMRRHVSEVWQRTPDIYGPVFTGIMGGLAPIIGQSMFLTHFTYQLIALAAVGAMLWLLWKRTRNPLVLAFIGLHPLLAVSVVNGGHPDALIALSFLCAFLFALERKVVLCALALAFGIAINFSVVVVAVALGVWAYWRWSKREVFTLAAISLGLGAVPYLFLSGWIQNAHEHQQLISRQSIWYPLASVLTKTGWFSIGSLSPSQLNTVMPNGTTLVAGVLLVFVLVRYTRRPTPDVAMAAAMAAFLVTSPWVMPWYAFAAFPFLAMRKPTLLAWAVALYSALILIGDQYPSLSPSAIGSFSHVLLTIAVPVVACVACVVAIAVWPRSREHEQPQVLTPLAA